MGKGYEMEVSGGMKWYRVQHYKRERFSNSGFIEEVFDRYRKESRRVKALVREVN